MQVHRVYRCFFQLSAQPRAVRYGDELSDSPLPILCPMSTAHVRALLVLAISVAAAGCTTPAKNVPARYVPPSNYQPFSCHQLTLEYQRVQGRLLELGGKLDTSAKRDATLGAFGAVIFFPSLLLLSPDTQSETEYSTLRGEFEAMKQAAFMKRCTGLEQSAPATD